MPSLTPQPTREPARVLDLRGATAGLPASVAVLEDRSGRRRVRMRRIGRATASLFALWLAVLLIGGLGLVPVGGIPLAGALKPPTQPPLLDDRILRPLPRAAVRGPAVKSVESARARAVPPRRSAARQRLRSGGSGGAPASRVGTSPTGGGQTPRPASSPNAGTRGASAPGRLGTVPGGGTSNNLERPTQPGRSTTAPGQTRAAPGKPTATPEPAGSARGVAVPVGAGPPAE